MKDNNKALIGSLKEVKTSCDFENWVRFDLRKSLPHSAFLGTVGKLYGVGSVSTYRAGVDFPLAMVEKLKNKSGALDDPLLFGWFRTERLRFLKVDYDKPENERPWWHKTFIEFGVRNMMVHGVLDHKARQFVAFELMNLYDENSDESMRLVSSLVRPMYEAVLATMEIRNTAPARRLFGHPTIWLTDAEIEIIEYLAQGLSNKEIARRRGVSDSTVKTQVARTGAKIGASRRSEIVAIALTMLSPLPAQGVMSYDDD